MKALELKGRTFAIYRADARDPAFYERYEALFVACFGRRDYLDRAWYEWYNLNCPMGEAEIYVIEDQRSGTLAAGYSLLPWPIVVDGRLRSADLCTNGMTHPDYQGMGMFTQIAREALPQRRAEGVEVTLGFPNVKAIRGHIKVGWQIMPELHFLTRRAARPGGAALRELPRFSADQDAAIRQMHARYAFYVDKEHRLLNWRFVDRPHIDYTCLALEQGGTLVGYAVVKIYASEQERKLHIVDFAYLEREHLTALLAGVEAHAATRSADLVNLWLLEACRDERALLEASGYAPEGSSMFIIHSEHDFLNRDLSSWHVVLGDNDVY